MKKKLILQIKINKMNYYMSRIHLIKMANNSQLKLVVKEIIHLLIIISIKKIKLTNMY